MYNGLERDISDPVKKIEQGPHFALNAPDMRLCVNVMTAGRPNYLYICLDSIFRNTVFALESRNSPDVYIYVDIMTDGESFAGEILKVASHFPVRGVFINGKHKGIAMNTWYSFSQAFDMGYDFCVNMEEDWLITTHALQWLYDVPKIAAHYSLYRWTDRMDRAPDHEKEYEKYCCDGAGYTLFREGKFLSWCAAFSRDGYKFIDSIRKVDLCGMYDPERCNLASMFSIERLIHFDWDKTLISILKKYGLLSMAPSVSQLAHFGSQSSNYSGYAIGGSRHDQMFSGDKEHWLDNVIEIFNSTTDDEKGEITFFPLTFKYS